MRPEDKINPPACFEAEKALRRKEKKRKNRESKRPVARPGDDEGFSVRRDGRARRSLRPSLSSGTPRRLPHTRSPRRRSHG